MKKLSNAFPRTSAGVLVLSMFIAASAANVAQAQVAQIAATATAGAVVNELTSGINDSIENARQAGDYVTAVALARALEALDAWKKANVDILDKAFASLDEASRANFGRIRATVADIDAKVGDRLQQAAALGDSANQIVASFPGGRPFISRFQPRVVPPTATSDYTVRVNGVSLDKAEPVLALKDGAAKRAIIGANEVQFSIPVSFTPRDANRIQMHTLAVTYTQPKPGIWSWMTGQTETVSRQLPIVALPANLATFKVEGMRTFNKREEKGYELDLGQYKGKNKDIVRAGAPLTGWNWDTANHDQFSVWGTGGEKASCKEVDWSSSNPYSVSVRARVDSISPSLKYPKGAPGKITCHVKGPIYRLVSTTEPIKEVTGTIGWLEDSVVKLPEDMNSYQVTVTTFDGRKRVFSGEDADKFFEVRKTGNTLTFVPRVPSDVL